MALGWPSTFVGIVTQDFGPVSEPREPDAFSERDANGPLRAFTKRFPGGTESPHVHLGLDIRAFEGTSLFAAEAGEIIATSMFANGDMYVQIRIQPGVVIHYSHCSAFVRTAPDTVARGDEIAKAGHTGNANGAHLHFEVRITEVGSDGVGREMRYNPARFFAELGGDMVDDPRIIPAGGLEPMIDVQRGNSYALMATVRAGSVLRQHPSATAPAVATLPTTDTELGYVGNPGGDWRAVAFFRPAQEFGLTGLDVQHIVYVPTDAITSFAPPPAPTRGRGRGGGGGGRIEPPADTPKPIRRGGAAPEEVLPPEERRPRAGRGRAPG